MSIETAIEALAARFGDHLVMSEAIRHQFGQNEGYFPVTPPDAVLSPGSTEEVADAVKICAEHACPIIPHGTGTSLEGAQLAFDGGVALSMSRMNRVLAVNDADMDAVVQPGVTRKMLNEELRATGLFFPVDPGADASIGGMAATRASGTTAVRYGTMRENVLALEVVLADGRIVRTGTRARKSSSGYDLTKLIVGSEGTLGIITELTVKLAGQPEAVSAAICAFDNFQTAVDTVIATMQMGIPMARIEFVDEMMARGFNLYDESANLPEKPHLFVEFHGSTAGVAEQAKAFGELVDEMGGGSFRWTDEAEERNALWRMRHRAYYATKAHLPNGQIQNTDICVPMSRLAEGVALAREKAASLDLSVSMVGHVGDGNFHCGINLTPGDEDERARAAEFSGALNELALSLGGTITGEHGVGYGKMRYMGAEHGEALSVMAAIKTTLDPKNILNPGKVVPLG